jgi:hypothetical protein
MLGALVRNGWLNRDHGALHLSLAGIEPLPGRHLLLQSHVYGRTMASVRSLASALRHSLLPEDGVNPEQSTATASAAQISLMRPSASRPRRSTSTATDTLSTESRLTAERLGMGSSRGSRSTSLARPRIVVGEGMTSALRAAGSLRRVIGPQLDVYRLRARPTRVRLRRARTTSLPRVQAALSRSRGNPPKRGEIAPLIPLVERVIVIGRVACIDRRGAVPPRQRLKGFIDERGVTGAGAESPSAVEQLLIHSRAQACASHAMSMPPCRRE